MLTPLDPVAASCDDNVSGDVFVNDVPAVDNTGDVDLSGDAHMIKMPDIDDSGDAALSGDVDVGEVPGPITGDVNVVRDEPCGYG